MNLSIIVPYWPDNGDRDLNWGFNRPRLEALFPDAELLIGGDAPGVHARCMNNLIDKATGDVLMLLDSDVIVNALDVLGAATTVSVYGEWGHLTTYHQLPRGVTEGIRMFGDPASEMPEPEDTLWSGPSVAPPIFITRNAMREHGLFDERYRAWGADDIALTIMLTTLWKPPVRFPGSAFHLDHERDRENAWTHDLTGYYQRASGDRDAVLRIRDGARIAREANDPQAVGAKLPDPYTWAGDHP